MNSNDNNNDKKGEESDSINGGGVGNGEVFICYMCYETHVCLIYIFLFSYFHSLILLHLIIHILFYHVYYLIFHIHKLIINVI
jgi:hypothetical protein